MRTHHLILLLSGLLVLLGSAVLAGWYLHEPVLVRLFVDREGMSPAAGLGFVLAGVASAAAAGQFHGSNAMAEEGRCGVSLSWLFTGCALALTLLGTLALVEWVFDIPLGLSPDPDETLTWLVDTIITPGRTRPLSALGFIALGAGFYLLPRSSSTWHMVLTPVLALSIICIGFLGIIAQLADIGGLIPSSFGPSFIAGFCFVVSSIALLFLQSLMLRRQQAVNHNESQRITLIATVIVAVTGMVGTIGGFGVLYTQMVEELDNNLEIALNLRRTALENEIRDALRDSYYFFDNSSLLTKTAKRPSAIVDNPELLGHTGFREFGFTGVRLRDATGKILAHEGTFIPDPEFKLALVTAIPSELMWHEGFVLRLFMPIVEGDKRRGTLEFERPLQLLDPHKDISYFGNTLDFPVCAAQGSTLHCFPFRSAGWRSMRELPQALHGVPISLAYGLRGGSGVIRTIDYRGTQVIAAYGPIGALGLVANLEVDASEFYQRIAHRLWPLLILMFLIALTSIFLLRLEVMPLVRRMATEIDERRRAEESLQESESKLAEITATLGEGVYVFDEHGIVSFVNPEAERILGWGTAEITGKRSYAAFHYHAAAGQTYDLERSSIFQALHTGHTHRSSDEIFVHKNGGLVPVSVAASPIVRNGVIKGCVASFEDITQKKRVEVELSNYRQHLEQLVEARTSELQKLNHELESFSYSVSHDLRAPLRTLKGFNSALREDFGRHLPPEAHHYLQRVDSAAARMGELIDGLLMLSQVVRSTLQLDQVDLGEMAAGIVSSLKESDPQRHVNFSIQKELVTTGDARLLHTLLENLFSNAWKFTASKPESCIEFACRSSAQGERVFYVRDNGTGFDLQLADKLFQPFQRFHTREEFPGNGIGLATVQRIVHRHGGHIWAESVPGAGTTIFFTLAASRD